MTASTSAPAEQPPGDHTLVRWTRAGDEAAATELYHRYFSRLRGLITARCQPSLTACTEPEDIIQSVFRALYVGIRDDRYQVPHGQELWGLLFVIAMNKIRNLHTYHRAERRSSARTTALDLEELQALPARDDGDAGWLRVAVEEYLANLDDDTRAVVGLRMTGHSVEEIALEVKRARRSVERLLQKARQELLDRLK